MGQSSLCAGRHVRGANVKEEASACSVRSRRNVRDARGANDEGKREGRGGGREVPPLRVSESADAPVGMTARVGGASDGAEVSLRGPMKSEERFLTSFEMTGKGDTKKKRRPAPFDPVGTFGMQKAQMTGQGWGGEVRGISSLRRRRREILLLRRRRREISPSVGRHHRRSDDERKCVGPLRSK